MGDSFADLWNSSAPVKPSEPARKLGASPAPVSRTLHPKYDAFTLLAASSSNSSSPRSLTPSSKPPVSGPRSNSGGAAAATSGDAFDDLLSGSLGNGSSNAKLTMAEKAAKAKTIHQQPATPLYDTTAWAGLDSLAGATSSSSSSSQMFKSVSSGLDDDWIFGSSTSSAQAESAPTLKPSTDDWGLDSFVSPPKSSSESPGEPSSQGKSLWDLDDFKSSSEGDQDVTSSAQKFPPSHSDTPGDFDFGDREDALLNDDSGSDDDILGDLGRAVHEQPVLARRPLPPVCDVSLTRQTCTDFLTIIFLGCGPRISKTLPPTPSYWSNRRNGILP